MLEAKWAAEGAVFGELIDRQGYGRREFAQRIGVSEDVLSNTCIGRTRLRGPRLSLAATALKMSEDELRVRLARAHEPRPPSSRDASPDKGPLDRVNVRGKIIVVPQGSIPVPIFSSVPASMPSRTFSQASDVEFVPEHDADLPVWGTYVSGDSMNLPTDDPEDQFKNGDIVIFEERAPLPYQAVYAEKDGEETFKILVPEGETFELWPLNDAYEPFSALDWNIRGVLRRRVRYGKKGDKGIQEYSPTRTFRVGS